MEGPLLTRHPATLTEVVEGGLCIGCGLCEALAKGLTMDWQGGVLRPRGNVIAAEEATILDACPGAVVAAHLERDQTVDPVWGAYRQLVMAWSGEPEVRYRAATGGVLTGLARHALISGQAEFVLHAGPHPTEALLSHWVISDTPDQVLENSGSRYAPVSVLAGLAAALDRDRPFVLVAKPCDISAARRLARTDRRLAENCVAMLTMVCGGASNQSKTLDALRLMGVDPKEAAAFRYRGEGNPGPHRVTLVDGSNRTLSYQDMWADEGSWAIQPRCKLCADPIGEAADIAAADCWPGGAPTGEDEGFNGVLVRTQRGADLLASAVDAGMIVRGRVLDPADFTNWQPHNVRKTAAVPARLRGLAAAGQPIPQLVDLRTADRDAVCPDPETQQAGAQDRARSGKFTETARVRRV